MGAILQRKWKSGRTKMAQNGLEGSSFLESMGRNLMATLPAMMGASPV
jgi:hypothetical protein